MAERCQAYVKLCGACIAANPQPDVAPDVRNDTPSRPWEVVQVDTLELGPSTSSKYHCVMVCIDMFTKWVEVIPLRRHDGESVASAFVDLCTKWGPPRLVRSDMRVFGVTVQHGAVRHPQSQGAAERFNRSLLTMIRKTIDDASDWMQELKMLVYYYRARPHSMTRMSPMMAMVGWEPRNLTVESMPVEGSLMSWSSDLSARCARIRDIITEALAENDAIIPTPVCPLVPDQPVMLRNPNRRQKRLPQYERGWKVKKVVSPTTVVIVRAGQNANQAEKIVNVELLKRDAVEPDRQMSVESDGSDESSDEAMIHIPLHTTPEPRYNLRDRGQIVPPNRLD